MSARQSRICCCRRPFHSWNKIIFLTLTYPIHIWKVVHLLPAVSNIIDVAIRVALLKTKNKISEETTGPKTIFQSPWAEPSGKTPKVKIAYWPRLGLRGCEAAVWQQVRPLTALWRPLQSRSPASPSRHRRTAPTPPPQSSLFTATHPLATTLSQGPKKK